MPTVKIYRLICPITGITFYIGATVQPLHKRLYGHVGLQNVRFLKRRNKKAIIEEIETVTKDQANEREAYWIRFYKHELNMPLENRNSRGYHTNKQAA